jgi:hypothetical protein
MSARAGAVATARDKGARHRSRRARRACDYARGPAVASTPMRAWCKGRRSPPGFSCTPPPPSTATSSVSAGTTCSSCAQSPQATVNCLLSACMCKHRSGAGASQRTWRRSPHDNVKKTELNVVGWYKFNATTIFTKVPTSYRYAGRHKEATRVCQSSANFGCATNADPSFELAHGIRKTACSESPTHNSTPLMALQPGCMRTNANGRFKLALCTKTTHMPIRPWCRASARAAPSSPRVGSAKFSRYVLHGTRRHRSTA